MRAIITGGAGFIGSALVRHSVINLGWHVLNIDKLTYAGNLDNLSSVAESGNYTFLQADITNKEILNNTFSDFKPNFIINLAAESHVDRSIQSQEEFIQTNIIGTYRLLEAALSYYRSLSEDERTIFRFHQVSTDEVYGSLGDEGLFTEDTPYDPSSPYSASKASADHLVMAWFRTFGLPVTISNCSNNYGPYQYPEKLIPLMILNALSGKPLPVYGTGNNVRDWLYVDDHVDAIIKIIMNGVAGEVYNVGGDSELKNIDVVKTICAVLNETHPLSDGNKYEGLISFVKDRPGHDFRYAIDFSKIKNALGWEPRESFETGIRKTIDWYVKNYQWRDRLGNRSQCKKQG